LHGLGPTVTGRRRLTASLRLRGESDLLRSCGHWIQLPKSPSITLSTYASV
jgi:hypothetical protein